MSQTESETGSVRDVRARKKLSLRAFQDRLEEEAVKMQPRQLLRELESAALTTGNDPLEKLRDRWIRYHLRQEYGISGARWNPSADETKPEAAREMKKKGQRKLAFSSPPAQILTETEPFSPRDAQLDGVESLLTDATLGGKILEVAEGSEARSSREFSATPKNTSPTLAPSTRPRKSSERTVTRNQREEREGNYQYPREENPVPPAVRAWMDTMFPGAGAEGVLETLKIAMRGLSTVEARQAAQQAREDSRRREPGYRTRQELSDRELRQQESEYERVNERVSERANVRVRDRWSESAKAGGRAADRWLPHTSPRQQLSERELRQRERKCGRECERVNERESERDRWSESANVGSRAADRRLPHTRTSQDDSEEDQPRRERDYWSKSAKASGRAASRWLPHTMTYQEDSEEEGTQGERGRWKESANASGRAAGRELPPTKTRLKFSEGERMREERDRWSDSANDGGRAADGRLPHPTTRSPHPTGRETEIAHQPCCPTCGTPTSPASAPPREERRTAGRQPATSRARLLSGYDSRERIATKRLKSCRVEATSSESEEEGPHHRGIKAMDIVRTWNIKFHGGTTRDAADFANSLKRCCKVTGLTWEDIREILPDVLRGEARTWYKIAKRKFESLRDFRKKFLREFGPEDTNHARWEEARRRRQGANEKLRAYIYDVRSILADIRPRPSIEEQLELVYRNMQPKYRQRIGHLEDFEGFTDLEDEGRLVEREMEYDRAFERKSAASEKSLKSEATKDVKNKGSALSSTDEEEQKTSENKKKPRLRGSRGGAKARKRREREKKKSEESTSASSTSSVSSSEDSAGSSEVAAISSGQNSAPRGEQGRPARRARNAAYVICLRCDQRGHFAVDCPTRMVVGGFLPPQGLPYLGQTVQPATTSAVWAPGSYANVVSQQLPPTTTTAWSMPRKS